MSRIASVVAALVLSLAVVSFAEATAPFRFIVSFTTDLENYLQADEFLNPTQTMNNLNCPPVFGGGSSPLCDPAFVGWYRDVYTVGVIDGLELALGFFQNSKLICGDLISAISDGAAAKIQQIDPRLRGSQGAAIQVITTALSLGCTIQPLP